MIIAHLLQLLLDSKIAAKHLEVLGFTVVLVVVAVRFLTWIKPQFSDKDFKLITFSTLAFTGTLYSSYLVLAILGID